MLTVGASGAPDSGGRPVAGRCAKASGVAGTIAFFAFGSLPARAVWPEPGEPVSGDGMSRSAALKVGGVIGAPAGLSRPHVWWERIPPPPPPPDPPPPPPPMPPPLVEE